MKSVSSAWLSAANDDLLLIEEILHNEVLTHLVAFHSQQAIEKSFKAVLEEKEGIVPRIHNLETLLPRVACHVDLQGDIELLEDLDKLYIDSRYPGDLGLLPYGKPTLEDAERFFRLACGIFRKIAGDLAGNSF